MANIMDYLDWRGDIPFSVSPFGEVDSLVFSQFCFIDLTDIVPGQVMGDGMPLCQAVERYFEKYPDDSQPLGLIVPPQTRPLMRRMAESVRYRDVIIRGFVNHIDENIQKQFAAMTLEMGEREVYVVFRGTDDTLVGWKENFNMSFLRAIPAQLDAVAYLNEAGRSLAHEHIHVGGHSKGGNLAIYAAIHCEQDIKERIVRVYSNDGPGYRREVIDSADYKDMEERIVNIIPQSSVIGRLLEHDERYVVVQSTASGLWQHDAFTWEIKGTQFVPAPALTQESEMIDRSLKKWIAEMSDEQREQVVDALYRILTANNAKTLTELTHDKDWFFRLVGNSDPQARKTLFAAISQLTGEAGRQWIEGVLPTLGKNSKGEGASVTAEHKTVKPTAKAVAVKGGKATRVTPQSVKPTPPKATPTKEAPKKDALTLLLELIAAEKKKGTTATGTEKAKTSTPKPPAPKSAAVKAKTAGTKKPPVKSKKDE